MKPLIMFGIGQMELDWGKHGLSNNHHVLFQKNDIKMIPYYYYSWEKDALVTHMKEGFSRSIRSILPRLNLLGYDLSSIRTRFDELVRDHEAHGMDVPLSFDAFFDAIRQMDLSAISTVEYELEGYDNGYDLGEYAYECILQIPELNEKLVGSLSEDCLERIEVIKDLAFFLENMDPYITLRIIAENPANLDLELQWNFFDEVENGWMNWEDVVCPVEPMKRVLIVTEGSSDSFVLKKAIQELYPEISDFFDFVDMKENYPFTGTGNLYNFCLGLCRIHIQNNIIVVFDNDTAGVEKYKQARKIEKPKSFLVTKLPDYSAFCEMETIGPQGTTRENINGKAVAIECFLDFKSVDCQPRIRWTEYKKSERAYQGELENKDEYVRAFKHADIKDSAYDNSKLKYVIDYLVTQWTNRLGDNTAKI